MTESGSDKDISGSRTHALGVKSYLCWILLIVARRLPPEIDAASGRSRWRCGTVPALWSERVRKSLAYHAERFAAQGGWR